MSTIMQALALLAAGPIATAVTTGASAEGFEYDVVIRNGRLLDGLGNPWFAGSVAIKDGCIAASAGSTVVGGRKSTPQATTSRPAGST
jgi:adenine deaminase